MNAPCREDKDLLNMGYKFTLSLLAIFSNTISGSLYHELQTQVTEAKLSPNPSYSYGKNKVPGRNFASV
jgi:hypothetical protein